MARPIARGLTAPRLRIRPPVIRENAAAVRERFDGRVVGVTKAVSGDPVVARAMLEGGVDSLADARTANLERLDDAVETHLTQLVCPMPSAVERVVRVADRTFHSEPTVIEAVSAAGGRADRPHEVVLMVDTGDRREGLLPDDVLPVVSRVIDRPGTELVGLGTIHGCFGGVLPTAEQLERFVELVAAAEAAVGREFPVVSGGSSVTLPLVEDGALPARVNELRIGEAILLGTDVSRDRQIPYLSRDGFELVAEVIECQRKPTLPVGEAGLNVDGEAPEFADRGDRDRAVLALGSQDTDLGGLEPIDPGIEVLGGSSDHAVLDVTEADRSIGVGDGIRFRLGYQALVHAATSEYVAREVVDGDPDASGAGGGT